MPYLPRRVLAVSAHPDDAEHDAFGAIAAWAQAGAEIALVVCTSGERGSGDAGVTPSRRAAVREEEQRASAHLAGIREVVFLRRPDGGLEDTRELRGALVREIRRWKPDVVLAPDPVKRDFYWHRDHRVAGAAAMDAALGCSASHLHYPEHRALGLAPHRVAYVYLWDTESPTDYVDIGAALELKIEALKVHEGHKRVKDLAGVARYVRDFARQAGAAGGLEYAEAFRVLPAPAWSPCGAS